MTVTVPALQGQEVPSHGLLQAVATPQQQQGRQHCEGHQLAGWCPVVQLSGRAGAQSCQRQPQRSEVHALILQPHETEVRGCKVLQMLPRYSKN